KTKTAFCTYFEDELIENTKALAHVKKLFDQLGEPLLQVNRDQAKLPSKAQALFNRFGTAPGMWFEENKGVYVALPGIPYEMKALTTGQVLPRLAEGCKRPYILQKTVLTYGVGESRLADKITSWENALPGYMGLAYLPGPGRVRLRLTARGEDREA